MNKEELQSRIEQINGQLVNARNQINVLQGHLSECHHWLATILNAEIQVQPESEEQQPLEQCE